MNTFQMKQMCETAKQELLADGWVHTCTILMDSDDVSDCGLKFEKDGIVFYLNERTCTYKPGLTGPEMALEWKSVFN